MREQTEQRTGKRKCRGCGGEDIGKLPALAGLPEVLVCKDCGKKWGSVPARYPSAKKEIKRVRFKCGCEAETSFTDFGPSITIKALCERHKRLYYDQHVVPPGSWGELKEEKK
jgi:hypothetical protein